MLMMFYFNVACHEDCTGWLHIFPIVLGKIEKQCNNSFVTTQELLLLLRKNSCVTKCHNTFTTLLVMMLYKWSILWYFCVVLFRPVVLCDAAAPLWQPQEHCQHPLFQHGPRAHLWQLLWWLWAPEPGNAVQVLCQSQQKTQGNTIS